ncbi:MAG: SPOR domain-containing protein [Gallionellaceae bacterium]
MLKWLFALLLAVNLALFAYLQWGGAPMQEGAASQSQPPLNAEKIKLLKAPASSPGATQVIAQPVAAMSAVQAASTPAGSQQTACMEWGEFSGNELARATQALAALKLGDRLAQHQSEHKDGYWVYLPPQSNHADVDRKIAELKALGITDYFVVQDSKEWLNAISLGIFKTEDAARKFLNNIKAKGAHSAVMGARSSNLKFTVFDLKNLDPGLAEKISALQKQFADSELKVVPCPR